MQSGATPMPRARAGYARSELYMNGLAYEIMA